MSLRPLPPPWLFNPMGWLPLTELARRLGRPYFTVYWWLKTGQLAAFGIRTYRDRSLRWWSELPPGL